MPSARASSRGAALKCRFAVNGIHHSSSEIIEPVSGFSSFIRVS
jgi:hypothetical protein